ncbi:saccharopine dehydrogenase C-terminal domain-containing protein [Streptomyces sp. NPDC021608]|uniref:saccharopine dehydrogenase C-terminal domain-containing protein n=1 Tax=Streptomyces sp. NPDC021608 TaxID=3154903 RepID=UPI0033D7D682
MPQKSPVAASGTIHWIGTGLSTGRTGLGLLCDRTERLVLWDRTAERAEDRLAGLGLAGRADVRALSPTALSDEVRAGDVVVSMLPAAEHPGLLRLAAARQAHFACTSYTSPELSESAQEMAADGLVVLTEAGLDPGIDHLMAHQLVQRARQEVGDTAASVHFTSFCGGVPVVPNDFRYRFSWAPYGVLAALGSPARFVAGGRERTAQHPWEATQPLVLDGEEFEVYPNRDSMPFAPQYGFPGGWHLDTFIRGTLRNAGWRAAWSEVFSTVRTRDDARIRALAKELADRYPTGAADRDRVVLSVALELRGPGGGTQWRGERLLDVTGEERESAMAKCVSLPLAFGLTRVLQGALSPGLHRAAESAEEANRWLSFLRGQGLRTRDLAPDGSDV